MKNFHFSFLIPINLFLLLIFFVISCNLSTLKKNSVASSSSTKSPVSSSRPDNHPIYAPSEGKILLIAGQDLGAVGGLPNYNEGYVDYIGMPAGITTYSGTNNLRGLFSRANWGSGDACAQYYLDADNFKDIMIVLGLYMVGDLQNVLDGVRDSRIERLGNWIKNAQRPVLLRIGYEFEAKWNYYDPGQYVKAFRKIVDDLTAMGVTNFATVWQSSGYNEKREKIMPYYPGDDYTDWFGYSYFEHEPDEAGKVIRALAREKKKPVIIAEVTPRYYDCLLGDGKEIWNKWYAPFFNHVKQNKDIIKAVAYINVRWQDQPMWKKDQWGDSRVQANPFIKEKWIAEMKKDQWIHTSFVEKEIEFVFPANFNEMKEKALKERSTSSHENAWEVENAQTNGNVKVYPDTRASNGKGLAYIMDKNDSFWFEKVPKASGIIIRYASEKTGSLGIYVNQKRVTDFNFKSTGSWVGTYRNVEIKFDIPQDAHLKIQFDEGDVPANIDYFVFLKE